MMQVLADREGFTLIELLVVIAIIGILAASALPQVMSAICDARVSSAQGDMATIKTAATQCEMDTNCTSGDLNTMGSYLPERITDDTVGGQTWSYTGSQITVDDVGCVWEDENLNKGSSMRHKINVGNFAAY